MLFYMKNYMKRFIWRSSIISILVYVDDIIIAGNDQNKCNEIKSYLNSNFKST